ncbi:hypothetical protein [Nocardioides speluncae]|uniref:hypothetical protein n=1 Tax=Nocardioides speluncae TaxID=2670337 RepID=UPI0012B17514|nr:hypothetical protein [Nocardioides speluncae]
MNTSLGKTDPPAAVRASTPSWRDPRMWVGIAIVAASVLAGAKVVGGADESVPVWAAAGELGAGDTVTADDLVQRRVRFTDASDADRYLSADEAPPADSVLLRGIGEGELVPRAALGGDDGERLTQVALAAESAAVPPSVVRGATVTVWVVPDESRADSDRPAEKIFTDVTVLATPQDDGTFGPTGTRQVVVGVPTAQVEFIDEALAATAQGTITFTGKG